MPTKKYELFVSHDFGGIMTDIDKDDPDFLNCFLTALSQIHPVAKLRELRFDDQYLYTIQTDIGSFEYDERWETDVIHIYTKSENKEGIKKIFDLLLKNENFEADS